MDVNEEPAAVSVEQLRYARWLEIGTRIGLALLLGSFALYSSGLVEPRIPLSELPSLWVMPVDQYLAATGLPSGWGWTRLALQSDIMNFVGIAFLSLVTMGCYGRLAIHYLRSRDTACAWIAIAEIVVLVLAASGIIVAGH